MTFEELLEIMNPNQKISVHEEPARFKAYLGHASVASWKTFKSMQNAVVREVGTYKSILHVFIENRA